jgi:hypothetical protein
VRFLIALPCLFLLSCVSEHTYDYDREQDQAKYRKYVEDIQAQCIRTAKLELEETIDLKLKDHGRTLSDDLKGFIEKEEEAHHKQIESIHGRMDEMQKAFADHKAQSIKEIADNRTYVRNTVKGFDQRLQAMIGQVVKMAIVDGTLKKNDENHTKKVQSNETESKRNSQDLLDLRDTVKRLKENQDGFLAGRSVADVKSEQKQLEEDTKAANQKAADANQKAEDAQDSPLMVAFKGFLVILLTVGTMYLKDLIPAKLRQRKKKNGSETPGK